MSEKLTYEEYQKASAAGMTGYGGACACLGPRDDEEYCPCRMHLLNILTDEGQEKMKEQWRENNVLSASEWKQKYIEDAKDDLEKNPYRKKRLELMKQKGMIPK